MPSEPPPDERELLIGWGAGDERAGAELFRRYYPAVERFFRNKVSDAVHDELIQATFLACVEGRDRLRDGTSLRSYLFSIAYKQLCSHYRRLHRQSAPLDTSEISVGELAPGPSTLLARRQEHRLLAEALRAIPLDCQVVLELCYWEEQTAAQIGEILGIPVGTAKTRIRRARQLVGERLVELSGSGATIDVASDLDAWVREMRNSMTERR